MAELPRSDWTTMAALSLSLGASAFALMAAAAVLGGRWKFVESLFGGLDRVYLVHKWFGIYALGFASFHFAFSADIDAWETASILSMPAAPRRLIRQLAFIALMLIVMLALNRKIPYHLWRWLHKFSGPLFLIVILHWLSIESPIALASAAGIWLAAWTALGVAAAAYKLALYPFLSAHGEYRVVGTSPGAAALQLQLEPVKRGIEFNAGQFGFLRMKEDGLREPHPFTIVSGGSPNENVQFLIRALGDYTGKLVAQAKVGMHADVYGPFGRFERMRSPAREIWIGGGVGISPFIAWLMDEKSTDFDNVTLFYFFAPGREFPSEQVVEDLARRRGAELLAVSGGADAPEFRHRFAEIVQAAHPENVHVSFCGPKGLLQRIRGAMREHRVPQSHVRYEYFEFR